MRHLRSVVTSLLFICNATAVHAQHYKVSEKGSKVAFSIVDKGHGNDWVKGTLDNVKGDIIFDPAHPEKSSFDIAVGAASANTGLPERDKDIKGPSLLNASLYPSIRIKSTSISADGKSGIIYLLKGNLTLKGITKPVVVQFTAAPMGSGYLFRGSFHINRLDYNVGEKGQIDNTVTLFVELRANKK